MTMMTKIGIAWLAVVFAIYVYLMKQVILHPSVLHSPARMEYIMPPLFFVLFFAFPGFIFVLIGKHAKFKD